MNKMIIHTPHHQSITESLREEDKTIFIFVHGFPSKDVIISSNTKQNCVFKIDFAKFLNYTVCWFCSCCLVTTTNKWMSDHYDDWDDCSGNNTGQHIIVTGKLLTFVKNSIIIRFLYISGKISQSWSRSVTLNISDYILNGWAYKTRHMNFTIPVIWTESRNH